MLVLTRKTNQAVIIGHNIEVRVAQVNGNHVRLAISAPKSIPVLREELSRKLSLKANRKVPGKKATA